MTEDRSATLAAHFDDSLSKLQARLAALADELRSARARLLDALSTLPAVELLSDHLRAEYADALAEVDQQRDRVVHEIDAFLSEVAVKARPAIRAYDERGR